MNQNRRISLFMRFVCSCNMRSCVRRFCRSRDEVARQNRLCSIGLRCLLQQASHNAHALQYWLGLGFKFNYLRGRRNVIVRVCHCVRYSINPSICNWLGFVTELKWCHSNLCLLWSHCDPCIGYLGHGDECIVWLMWARVCLSRLRDRRCRSTGS